MPARDVQQTISGSGLPPDFAALLTSHPRPGSTAGHSAGHSFHKHLRALQNETFLSFASLGDKVSIWLADDRGMSFHTADLTVRKLKAVAGELQTALQGPNGQPTLIEELSRKLYGGLFAPVEHVFEESRRLSVHFSDTIPFLPLASLRASGGEHLLDRISFRIAANFPANRPAPDWQGVGNDTKLLVVDAGSYKVSSPEQLSTEQPATATPRVERLHTGSALGAGDLRRSSSAAVNRFLHAAQDAELLHCRLTVSVGSAGPALHFASSGPGPGPVVPPSSNRPETQISLTGLPRGAFGSCKLLFLDADFLNRRQKDSEGLWRQTVRELHRTGATNVVLPLWNSRSPARGEFIQTFYAALIAGSSVEDSLRRAAMHIRAIPAWKHPHHWAGFLHSATNGRERRER